MYEVNRSIAIIRPKAPFLQWLCGLPGSFDASELTLDVLGQSSNALLIPPADDRTSLIDFVLQHYHSLFQAELADWCEDQSYWPQQLTPALFTQWFEIEIHPVLTDIVDTELAREPFVPLDLNPS